MRSLVSGAEQSRAGQSRAVLPQAINALLIMKRWQLQHLGGSKECTGSAAIDLLDIAYASA